MGAFIWLITLTLIQHLYSENVSQCPHLKYCVCHEHKMFCNGHGNDLRTIPRAPPFILKVYLRNIQLDDVTRTMVGNLTHCKMTSLYLKGNMIRHISADAFQDLLHLLLLDWQQHDLPIVDIGVMLMHVTSGLQTILLRASKVQHHSMNASVFQNLSELKSLTVSLHQLTEFDASGLSTLMKLEKLDLSSNRLDAIIFQHSIQNLVDLNLSGNNFVSVPDLCPEGIPTITPCLRNLALDNNAIRRLDVFSITCLHNLQKLGMNQNRIEVLEDNAFANLPKLHSLQIAHLSELNSIERLAFNSTSLRKIYFVMSHALTPKMFDPAAMFAHTPNLDSLDMTGTKMEISLSSLKDFFLTLKNITRLIMQDTYIKQLPDGVFSKLKKMRHLVLSGNYISKWNDTVFENATQLRSIFFDGCNIETITENSFPFGFRQNIKEIDLANNPFVCTCDLLWFRTWMNDVISNKSITFSQYPHRYECRGPNTKPFSLKNFNPTVKSCTPVKPIVIILSTVLPITAVSVVAGTLIYCYRWYLLYWMSLLRRRRHRQHSPLREIKYDGFVSYSNPNYDWVEEQLLNYLEPTGLTLCEHSRDFRAGGLIVDNVLNAMDASRKTILVISNDFMTSSWCQFELQMAFNGFLKDEVEIVVILLETIRARNMTGALRALMTSTTYLDWP